MISFWGEREKRGDGRQERRERRRVTVSLTVIP
jgi:hypothetical protein